MNMLIAEDDKIQRKSLKKYLQSIDKDINIYECEDKDEALELASINSIDIFYIDIYLKNSSGLDFALALRRIPAYEFSFIVFLTTHVEYLSKAIKKVHCYDYILKPYDKSDILKMTKKFMHYIRNTLVAPKCRRYVVLEIIRGINIKIYVDEIIFVEESFRICMIHTVNGIYRINKLALKNILRIINCKDIVRCHKSFAANINRISKIKIVDSKSSEIFFENYNKKALLGYKFKSTIMELYKG